MVDTSQWCIGRATAPAHHGEILQGTFADDGRLRRGLVTVPCPLYQARATFVPDTRPGIRVSPSWKEKARRAGELAIEAIGLAAIGPAAGAGGRLRIRNDAPVRRGFGSSTGDVLAAVWSVASAFRVRLSPTVVARLAVQAEKASDSLMFDESAVLFAHRAGEVIEDFEHPLPRARFLGFGVRVGRESGTGVDTLSFPPARYTSREIGIFGDLRALLRDAICGKNVELMGQVATASAIMNQRHLPVADFGRILHISREAGGVGVQVAHSGDIASLLFDADVTDVDARIAHAEHLLGAAGITGTWTF